MDLITLKSEVLRLVSKNDGLWYWYQLDRALAHQNPELVSASLMAVVNELSNEGLIEIRKSPERVEVEQYWITDAGRMVLRKSDT